MAQTLYVLGIGPGDENLVTPAAVRILEACDVLIGGKRNLALFRHLEKEELVVGNNLEEIRVYLASGAAQGKRVGVLVSGDPGLFSMLGFLKRALPGVEPEVVPGISSLQVLCARLGMSWDDMLIKSVHGREQKDLTGMIRANPKVALFTGGEQSPAAVCRMLAENGLGGVSVSVGENLSYETERVVRGTAWELQQMTFESLSIMIIENSNALQAQNRKIENLTIPDESEETKTAVYGGNGDNCLTPSNTAHIKELEKAEILWQYETPGIPDDRFIRGEVPMTKEEVRAVSVAKLRLTDHDVVYDIGAGTGSVSVECALRCRNGRVYALEKEEDALALLRQNAEAFGLGNIVPVAGTAPSAGAALPPPDRVFVGGSGGRMEEIVRWIAGAGKPVRMVLNTIALESTVEALDSLKKEGFEDIEVISLSVARSRPAGGKHLMQALNPIYIISGEKK